MFLYLLLTIFLEAFILNFSLFSSSRTANLLRFGDGLGDAGTGSSLFSCLDGERLQVSWSASLKESKNWTLLGDMYIFRNFLTGLFRSSGSEPLEDRCLFFGDGSEGEFSSLPSRYMFVNSESDLICLSSSEITILI